MKSEQIRKRNFAIELDQILQENIDCCIDDDGNELPCDYTEETVYNWIMEKEEYHLLTTNYVKEMIHLFMTDFRARMTYLRDNKLI